MDSIFYGSCRDRQLALGVWRRHGCGRQVSLPSGRCPSQVMQKSSAHSWTQVPTWMQQTSMVAQPSGPSAGHVQSVRLLQAGAGKDVADKQGVTALARASYVGHVEIVGLLLNL